MYMLQPQKWSNPFCIAVLIKSESQWSSVSEPAGLWADLLFLALTTAVWLVTNWKTACIGRFVLELQRPAFYDFSCPQFLRGRWVGGAELLERIRLVGSWLWGRKVGILLGFVWEYQNFVVLKWRTWIEGVSKLSCYVALERTLLTYVILSKVVAYLVIAFCITVLRNSYLPFPFMIV